MKTATLLLALVASANAAEVTLDLGYSTLTTDTNSETAVNAALDLSTKLKGILTASGFTDGAPNAAAFTTARTSFTNDILPFLPNDDTSGIQATFGNNLQTKIGGFLDDILVRVAKKPQSLSARVFRPSRADA